MSLVSRRHFLSVLALFPFAGVLPRRASANGPAIFNICWNEQWSEYNPRKKDGSPGDPFTLWYSYWDEASGIIKHVTEIGGRVHVNGKHVDLLSDEARREHPGLNRMGNRAWSIALDDYYHRNGGPPWRSS